jgi:hypothetical protein
MHITRSSNKHLRISIPWTSPRGSCKLFLLAIVILEPLVPRPFPVDTSLTPTPIPSIRVPVPSSSRRTQLLPSPNHQHMAQINLKVTASSNHIMWNRHMQGLLVPRKPNHTRQPTQTLRRTFRHHRYLAKQLSPKIPSAAISSVPKAKDRPQLGARCDATKRVL